MAPKEGPTHTELHDILQVTYRGSSLKRKCTPIGPYRRPMPRVLGGPRGVGVFLWARYPCRPVPQSYSGARGLRGCESEVATGPLKDTIQGYLTCKKTHPPRTLPQAYA